MLSVRNTEDRCIQFRLQHEVDEQDVYDAIIDSGADPFSFIDKDFAKSKNLLIMKERLAISGKYANGEKFKVRKFCLVNIVLNMSNLKKNLYLKMYLIKNLTTPIIIGNRDIHVNNLYDILRQINERRFGSLWPLEREELDDELFDCYADQTEEEVTASLNLLQSLAHEVSNEAIKRTTEEIVSKYDHLFDDSIRETPAKVKSMNIKLKVGATLDNSFRMKARPQPRTYEKEIEKQINLLLALGVIEPSDSPTWSQIHMAKKKDGNLRFCIDYVRLNALTEVNYRPLPIIDSIIRDLAGSTIFAKLDMTTGFHQVKLSKKSRRLSAFRYKDRIYQFTRVPFGLTNSPMHFMHEMNLLLGDLIGTVCFVYIDDIIIFGTEETFNSNLDKVLERLAAHDIILKRSKCLFGVREINYLGHTISSRGMTLDDSNKSVFRDMKLPTTVTQLRSALGLFGFFRKFLPSYAEKASILYSMTTNKFNKRKALVWSEEARNAFEQIKSLIIEASQLYFLQEEGEIRLYTDASTYAFGGALLQEQTIEVEGHPIREFVPIMFFSKSFSKDQRKWSVSDKESHAVFYGVRYLHHLIADREVKVFTDHKALAIANMNRVSASPKIQRMRAALATYNLTYVYIRGDENILADGLSRCLEEDSGEQGESAREGDNEDLQLEELLEELRIFQISATNELTEEEIQDILHKYHGELGHFGYYNTMRRIVDNGEEWEGFRTDLKKFIQGCRYCREHKVIHGSHQRISPFATSFWAPNQAWAIDVMSWQTDAYGYKHALVVIDCFHRWLTLKPLRTLSSLEINFHLWDLINSDGKPDIIISDLGSNLTARDIEEIIKFCEIHHVTSPPRSHQFNALAENIIKEIREQLNILMSSKIDDEMHPNWSELLPSIARIHNIREHSTTGVIPAHVRYGTDHHLAEVPNINSRENLIQRAREGIEQTIEERFRHSKNFYHQKIPTDALVYITNPNYDKNIPNSSRRIGPYSVLDQDGHQVLITDGDGSVKRVHRGEIRLYQA